MVEAEAEVCIAVATTLPARPVLATIGAFVAEVDGNLTLWAHDGYLADLHWTGKFRGPDFAPITFRTDTAYPPTLVDKKGRPLPTVIASFVTPEQAEIARAGALSQEDALLAAMKENPASPERTSWSPRMAAISCSSGPGRSRPAIPSKRPRETRQKSRTIVRSFRPHFVHVDKTVTMLRKSDEDQPMPQAVPHRPTPTPLWGLWGASVHFFSLCRDADGRSG
jgi:hypothetical protein